MPEQMPEDFGFSVQYGVGQKNEIDTFNGVVIKDLVEDGTAKADITFTDKEMSEIYEKMKAINVLEEKNFISKCESRSEEHTSELQSRGHLVCRLLLEKKKTNI